MIELLWFGVFSGLALAIPVGPMAILLVNTAISHGIRHAVAGALGMALVDLGYAFMTMLLGSAITKFLGDYGLLLSLTGVLVLVGIALFILISNIKLLRNRTDEPAASRIGSSPLKTLGLFMLATLLNPPTALYFLAIAPSLKGFIGSSLVEAALIFALGVFLGSVLWQQTLALAGTGLRKWISGRGRAWFGISGGVLILAMAGLLAARAVTG